MNRRIMPPQPLATELFDLAKVGTVGTGGAFATIKLADVSLLVSIGVGVLTFIYIAAKLYYLIKHGGRGVG